MDSDNKRYTVVISDEAKQMLGFLAQVSEHAATRLIEAFQVKAKSLEQFPERNPWLVEILADETEITHSHVIEENGIQYVEVHFERPNEEGFDSARCVLPTYTWIKREGFNDKEIDKFGRFLQNNAHLLYKYAGDYSCTAFYDLRGVGKPL